MKIKPVMDALERRNVDVTIVHTGQHYDTEMSDLFFTELGIRAPDHHLEIGSGTHAAQTAGVMVALEPVVVETAPHVMVVVGDVNSTIGAALVGAKAGCLVGHVEAGLRSRDWSMPEEINRVVTDRMSDYLFAPSEDAAENLRREGYRDDQIHLVGNVMIDSLLANLERARDRVIVAELGLAAREFGLVTLHRPDNVDEPVILQGLITALGKIADELPLVFPAHPRTKHRLDEMDIPVGIKIVPPAGYLDFIALEASAALVLTDSGGVQEETTALGVPCLTLRDNTERPVTITHGTNVVVGRTSERIIAEAHRVLNDPPPPRRPALWDGLAGERIAEILTRDASDRLRPTELAHGG